MHIENEQGRRLVGRLVMLMMPKSERLNVVLVNTTLRMSHSRIHTHILESTTDFLLITTGGRTLHNFTLYSVRIRLSLLHYIVYRQCVCVRVQNSYSIIYRRFLAANERVARDVTPR